jgi:phosphoglycolate phosphatase
MSPSSPRTAGLLVDLDGTLIDSFPGIAFAIRTAVEFVLPSRSLQDVRSFIGPPIREIYRKLLGEQPPEIEDELIRIYRSVYDSEGWRQSFLYQGVGETLRELACRNVPCFVVTNKPRVPTEKILMKLNLHARLTKTVCRDSQDPVFASKAEMTAYLVEEYRLDSSLSCFVGDSEDDAYAAEACGIPFYAAAYGYGGVHLIKTDRILSNFSKVLEHFATKL